MRYVLLILCATSLNAQTYALAGGGAVWQRWGTVLNSGPTDAGEATTQEPSLLYENSSTYAPAVLTNLVSGQYYFRMYYTCGYSFNYTCYAESIDGINWTPYTSNPILTVAIRNSVVRSGSTIHLYASTGSQINHYTTTDGVTLTLANAGVITSGSGGSWNSAGPNNTAVVVNGGTWYMLVEAYGGGNTGSIGLYTSTDGNGAVWTPYASNPVLYYGSGSPLTGSEVGGPCLYLIGSTYYLWVHMGPSQLPLHIYRYHSSDLIHWTLDTTSFTQGTEDEGVGLSTGGVGDPFVIQGPNNQTFLYYTASANGNVSTADAHIKVAIANMPLTQLVQTSEGASSQGYPDFGVSYNNLLPGLGGHLNGILNIGGPNQTWYNEWLSGELVVNTSGTDPLYVSSSNTAETRQQICNTSTGGHCWSFNSFGSTSNQVSIYGIVDLTTGTQVASFYGGTSTTMGQWLSLGANAAYGWSSSAQYAGYPSLQTGISSPGAALIALGNGTSGDHSGQLELSAIRSATASNTDLDGQLTLSSGTISYSFAKSYTSAPICTVQDQTFTNQASTTLTVSSTTLTIANSVGTTDTYNYICAGRN